MSEIFSKTHQAESEMKPPMLIILIDDDALFANHWPKVVEGVKGIELLTPVVETSEDFERFSNSISDADLSRTDVVIVDQYKYSASLITTISSWIEKLKHLNEDAWIVEVSGFLDESGVFPRSDSFIDRPEEEFRTFKAATDAPRTASAVIEAIKLTTNRGFIESQSLDSEKIPRKQAEESFNSLLANSYFTRVLEMAGIDEQSFKDAIMWHPFGYKPQIEILHNAWTLVGHLMAGTDEAIYSMSVTRLQESINKTIEEQETLGETK